MLENHHYNVRSSWYAWYGSDDPRANGTIKCNSSKHIKHNFKHNKLKYKHNNHK